MDLKAPHSFLTRGRAVFLLVASEGMTKSEAIVEGVEGKGSIEDAYKREALGRE